MASKVIPYGAPITLASDAVADDSDKTITVDALWKISAIYVSYVSSGTAGNRQLVLRIKVGSDIVYQSAAGAVQAASATVAYCFAPNLARETSVVAGGLDVPLPAGLVVGPGMSIQLIDTAAVAAAEDDMTIRVFGEKL